METSLVTLPKRTIFDVTNKSENHTFFCSKFADKHSFDLFKRAKFNQSFGTQIYSFPVQVNQGPKFNLSWYLRIYPHGNFATPSKTCIGLNLHRLPTLTEYGAKVTSVSIDLTVNVEILRKSVTSDNDNYKQKQPLQQHQQQQLARATPKSSQSSSLQHSNNRGGANYHAKPIESEDNWDEIEWDDWDEIDWDDKSQNRGQRNNLQQQHGKKDSIATNATDKTDGTDHGENLENSEFINGLEAATQLQLGKNNTSCDADNYISIPFLSQSKENVTFPRVNKKILITRQKSDINYNNTTANIDKEEKSMDDHDSKGTTLAEWIETDANKLFGQQPSGIIIAFTIKVRDISYKKLNQRLNGLAYLQQLYSFAPQVSKVIDKKNANEKEKEVKTLLGVGIEDEKKSVSDDMNNNINMHSFVCDIDKLMQDGQIECNMIFDKSEGRMTKTFSNDKKRKKDMYDDDSKHEHNAATLSLYDKFEHSKAGDTITSKWFSIKKPIKLAPFIYLNVIWCIAIKPRGYGRMFELDEQNIKSIDQDSKSSKEKVNLAENVDVNVKEKKEEKNSVDLELLKENLQNGVTILGAGNFITHSDVFKVESVVFDYHLEISEIDWRHDIYNVTLEKDQMNMFGKLVAPGVLRYDSFFNPNGNNIDNENNNDSFLLYDKFEVKCLIDIKQVKYRFNVWDELKLLANIKKFGGNTKIGNEARDILFNLDYHRNSPLSFMETKTHHVDAINVAIRNNEALLPYVAELSTNN